MTSKQGEGFESEGGLRINHYFMTNGWMAAVVVVFGDVDSRAVWEWE